MHDAKVLLVTQKDIAVDDPKAEDLYKIGVVAEIKHVVKNPHGNLSVVFEGISRAKITSIKEESGFLIATAISKQDAKNFKSTSQCDAMIYEVKQILEKLKNLHPQFDEDMRIAAEAITSPI